MIRPSIVFATLVLSAASRLAALTVNTEFEGGNADVVSNTADTVRIMPHLHEGRGWPCWWYLEIGGAEAGGELTLEVQAQNKPFREAMVLANTWCQPKHAWISTDEVTWTPTETPGVLTSEKIMRYRIKAPAASFRIAWGPPFTPKHAAALLNEAKQKLGDQAELFELARTRSDRPVQGIRIGAMDAPHQVWVQARQHAWEAGGSQVGRGFLQWYTSDEATSMRANTCIHFIPIMDVDNAFLGAGGKEAIPRDHNRDWATQPIYPEVAAAQKRIQEIQSRVGLDVFIDLHNPGASDPIFFFGPFAFERMSTSQQANYNRWIALAAQEITKPHPVQPTYRTASYVKTEEERGRMSSGWVRAHTSDSTLSVTLETGWNSPKMTIAGYGEVGAGLGRTLRAYLKP
ncbi:MAG: hypothetical protein JNJ83_04790 [Verrucomicrobiaceae bacterium]|nr:hypothetical protein [Verrucomicrobiaceae bacterium]